MPVTAPAVTSITDFILAGEGFFLAGLLVARHKRRYCAAWFWQCALLLLAVGAFIGGVDHGFLQAADSRIHTVVQHATWVVIGVLTLVTFLTVVEQFLDARWHQVSYAVAGLQFVAYLAAIPLVDDFRVVIGGYAPVMLWSLVCNVRGLRDGTGTWPMILSIVVALASSVIQVAGIRLSESIDHNSLYHAGMMVAVWLSYRGGLRLKGFTQPQALQID